ncbi:MAG TPA: hypothetical protein DCZ94_19225 [Lentisphaeria bacterium]|nr:MAG: hypothetical protein A2X48_01470 [Lentisphaerae bacterium GWF2_49_21]HBC89076.1 hypothetical protein [Lentisphaeria bacterium]
MNKTRIKSLVTLLDDDDPQTANQAMAELLSIGKIDSVISSLQESSAPKIRMRVHQLQAVLKTRKDRSSFAKKLKDNDTDLFQGLTELHLQWFDKDNSREIHDSWGVFLSSTSDWQPDSLKAMASMMKDFGYKTPDSEEFYPEYFCVGAVIDEYIGSDFILCSLAKLAGEFHGIKITIVHTPFGFGLCDSSGIMSFPSKDWMTCMVKNYSSFVVWPNSKILRLTASMIFFSSMIMQNFRYAYSAASCLCEPGKDNISKILPYPFGDK